MNSDRLARHYAALTPWERLPLILAASTRYDVVERERLARSAPQNSFRVPDYWGLSQGLRDLAALYLLQQLDLAAFYWECTAALESAPQASLHSSSSLRQQEESLGEALRMLGYRFIIRADGWKLLCAELQVEPGFLLRNLPGYQGVQHLEEVIRPLAFTADQAIAYLRRTTACDRLSEPDTPALPRVYRISTAADVARAMREYLAEKLDEWR